MEKLVSRVGVGIFHRAQVINVFFSRLCVLVLFKLLKFPPYSGEMMVESWGKKN